MSRQSLQSEPRNIIGISNEARLAHASRGYDGGIAKWMTHSTFILLENTNEYLAK
jgi:hypothetical protein